MIESFCNTVAFSHSASAEYGYVLQIVRRDPDKEFDRPHKKRSSATFGPPQGTSKPSPADFLKGHTIKANGSPRASFGHGSYTRPTINLPTIHFAHQSVAHIAEAVA